MCMLAGQAASYADVCARYLVVVKQLKKKKAGGRQWRRLQDHNENHVESHANCGTEGVSKWLLTYMASNCFIKK